MANIPASAVYKKKSQIRSHNRSQRVGPTKKKEKEKNAVRLL